MSETQPTQSSIEYLAKLADKLGYKEGWTDSSEYILNPANTSFKIMGRWFIKRPNGLAECLE